MTLRVEATTGEIIGMDIALGVPIVTTTAGMTIVTVIEIITDLVIGLIGSDPGNDMTMIDVIGGTMIVIAGTTRTEAVAVTLRMMIVALHHIITIAAITVQVCLLLLLRPHQGPLLLPHQGLL
jgi:hypothetical protein